MKPPRSVWVVTNGYGVACEATHNEDNARLWRKVGDTVTRYDLHRPSPKRKARKGERSKR